MLFIPKHVSKTRVLQYIKSLKSGTFQQLVQDRINSRFPSFHKDKIYVDENFDEIDTTCAICLQYDSDYQLNACGHMFHRHCILTWKKKSKTCPLCRCNI